MSVQNADHQADVIIVGGGLSGLTLACALGTAGVSTLVIDREPAEDTLQPDFDGRTTAIAYGAGTVLMGAGVWDHLDGNVGPMLDIRVTDQSSPLFLHYDHREVGDRPFGWIIENRVLRHALYRRLKQLPAVTHLAPATVTHMERAASGVRVTLADGQAAAGRLVVGADGKKSFCREQAGIKQIGWSYRQHAIVCTIRHTGPHGGVAVEQFLPAGPFAMLPLAGGHHTSIVWTEPSDRVDFYMNLSEERFTEELQLRVGDWLGDVTPVAGRWSWPLGLSHAERYIDTRLALVSESAHGMHPIAGQGLNVGIRDLAALAEVVVDAIRVGLDPGAPDVLERYQRWRRTDTVTLLATTDALVRLFSNDIKPLGHARRLGMAAINNLAPLKPAKQFFMRHAMGIVGELPRLVRGEAL
ncbi:UbiH/UbiF/VisC/COQ6 family ubiquinone biosynthesis hydroxylase [Niveispirillum cyanobacteriorum]|uniref:2-octaprenyl-6-methoxyphenyl hydroxylase n=2 Tax=Azospirillaceae TaxID=2829815 RepID=A0A2K9NED8_9PROT|nr:UbiH/UbiF/VisC/COQ6 family ubiquinone biosynthesis hydroxylase [Niveispirillum cyanobacteriorum]AIW60949.1 ubiquinone biosynthesis hydroxylase [Azospirillum sp. TH16]AUN31362.1 2-octaprenyl-6-methoxyphenyl hydroxylase [Niveispirillum cyanobacteriorum]GGE71850.1 2-octaprenyl-3-methyl-6-methoxy-1,4-benzoquinol hydroxylase [Niveispirillum cyanobacteriorum]